LVRVVRQDPRLHGVARARWRLADLRAALPGLAGYTLGGVSKALRRRGIRLKRGRLRVHSPDPAYAAKTGRIARARALAAAHPTRVAVWYADEVSCYRQPTLAPIWFPVREEPTTDLSHRANTRHRVIGALDAGSGRVVTLAGSKAGVAKLKAFLRALRAADPDRYLILVWDNWPVHAHPEVVAEARRLRIRILWLPTYAPWENPIEKLWRQLKQTVLHGHRFADDWEGLKAAIAAFLDRFAHGSDALLRYVGLLPN
jgi:transposase